MYKTLSKTSTIFLCGVLTVQFTGCGTILYPERKGQKAGRIDVGVALLDGLGLLLFLIPGVIAFAVDFNNGTIYVPGSSRSSLELKDMKQVKFDPKTSTLVGIERMIKEETGLAVQLDQDNISILELESTDDMIVRFERILPSMPERMASSVKN